MTQTNPVVTKEQDIWVLRLAMPSGGKQEYRCTTEGQARHLAQLFTTREWSELRRAS